MAAVKVEIVDEAEQSSNKGNPMGIFDPNIKIKTEPIDPVCENSDTEDRSQVFEHSFEEVLVDLPEVLSYINQLKASVIRQQLKLDKLHKRLKKFKKNNKKNKDGASITNVSTQTGEDALPQESAISSTLPTELPRSAPTSGPGTNYMSTFSNEVPMSTAHTSIPERPVAWVLGDSGSASGSGTLSLAEQVKQAAQSAMRNTSFVYEPNSGMYYDYGTGYYYNAEMGLYYDGNTGKYMYYDENTKTYIFHSQVEVFKKTHTSTEHQEATHSVAVTESNTHKTVKPVKIKVEKVKSLKIKVEKVKVKKENIVTSDNESQEEGECSDSENSAQSSDVNESEEEAEAIEESIIPAKVWPPCMRIIVQETSVDGLKLGTLFIVTCLGGTMGREGDHCVLIKDTGISKHHSRFSFNEEDGKYYLVDLGSRNGTNLNGKRISAALQESGPCEVVHGSVLIVGGTKLLCHIHSGTETCGHCEPGLIQKPQVKEKTYTYHAGGIGKEHRKELKRIRKKFGLASIKSIGNTSAVAGYEDRAQKRRVTVGSSHHEDKTKAASVHEAISEDNKGFKMLAKMGWSKGEALGREGGEGIMEPVLVEQRGNKAGLGTTSPLPTPFQPAATERRKGDVWKKTQERYDKACTQDAAALLEDAEDEEDNVIENLALQRTKKTNKRKDISPLSPGTPPREQSSIDERKNNVWKKTQMRIKEKKTATPSPPREDVDYF